ncbi:BLOC-1-related complex subunit 8 isoform X2 [Centropristis striata]|nr:BLOC-1-related complex subunit 8 isoform X2 [Centropristis striata]
MITTIRKKLQSADTLRLQLFVLLGVYYIMEDQEMQLKVRRVTDKFTESMYVLANEPSVALYRLQEHVRRSLPELVQHKTDMQSWEEQSQGAIYSVEYACSAVKSMTNSSLYFKNIDGLLRQAISMKEQISNSQGRRKRTMDSGVLKEGGEKHGSGM